MLGPSSAAGVRRLRRLGSEVGWRWLAAARPAGVAAAGLGGRRVAGCCSRPAEAATAAQGSAGGRPGWSGRASGEHRRADGERPWLGAGWRGVRAVAAPDLAVSRLRVAAMGEGRWAGSKTGGLR